MAYPVFDASKVKGRFEGRVVVVALSDEDDGPGCCIWGMSLEGEGGNLRSSCLMAVLPEAGFFSGVRVYD